MGLLSWIFPSEADRMDKADQLLEQEQWVQALDKVGGIEDNARAEAIRERAHQGLKRRNLELAVVCAEAGEDDQSREHMKLAAVYATKNDPDMRATRRKLRELRQAVVRAEQQAEQEQEEAAKRSGDELFHLPPDHPRVRFALLLEQYEPAHRDRIQALGPDAMVLLDVEDQKVPPQALDALVEREPLMALFRGVSLLNHNRPDLAEPDLRLVKATLGAHEQVGPHHTALHLATALIAQRREADALVELDEGLSTDPGNVGLMVNKALVLERMGQDAKADELARFVVQKNSRVMLAYKIMGRVRLKNGKRVEAAQALEAALVTNCTSGKCGSLPFDVEAGRMLAQIYLEDRINPARARELVGSIKLRLGGQLTWMEGYLDALTARNNDAQDVLDRVRVLATGLAPNDPRTQVLAQQFPGLA